MRAERRAPTNPGADRRSAGRVAKWILALGIAALVVSIVGGSVTAGGKLLWQAGWPVDREAGTLLSVDPTGKFVFVTSDAPQYRRRTVAYDATTGQEVWGFEFDSASSQQAVSPDGQILFLTEPGDAPYTPAATLAIDATSGSERWRVTYGDDESGRAVSVSPDAARVHVVVESRVTWWSSRIATYRASTGALLWTARVGANIARLAPSPDGKRVYGVGERQGDGAFVVTALRAATGEDLWTRSLAPKGDTYVAEALATTPDGRLVFANAFGSRTDTIATVALRSGNGSTRWTALDRGGFGSDLAVDPSGLRVYVSGSAGNYESHYLTRAYDALGGHEIWSERWDGSAEATEANDVDRANALALSPDGRTVFVTGSVDRDSGCDEPCPGAFGTVAYAAASGKQRWSDVSAWGDHGGASTIGVTPDGARVLVGGSSLDAVIVLAYGVA